MESQWLEPATRSVVDDCGKLFPELCWLPLASLANDRCDRFRVRYDGVRRSPCPSR